MTMTQDELKACCADLYSSPAVSWLLGDSYHPGGLALTQELVQKLRVGPGKTVVDVASGPGSSAILVARETGCDVIGVELSEQNVTAATRAAEKAGLNGQVRFVQGDAEALPLPDTSADGVLCECSLCTFPNKRAAVDEIGRVLRPGALLALSDVVAESDRLPDELKTVQTWVACVADARPQQEITTLLGEAGLDVIESGRHDEELDRMIEKVKLRLRVATALGEMLPEQLRGAAEMAVGLSDTARAAVADGSLGYASWIAVRR